MPRPWSETEFAGLLALSDVFCFYGAGPSFAMGRVVVGEAELLTLAVDPRAQGQGLGRTALQSYEDAAAARGAEVSFLEVAANNHTAIKLYMSHGYSESGTRRGYYTDADGAKVDALVLSKPLVKV
ncbi:GNAT family N-acetyltransferase [Pacificibacter maritimus]|nr:GNAT family N-acetyltransferase [Pacificibacter maritimus]